MAIAPVASGAGGGGGVGAGGKVFAGHLPIIYLCPLVMIVVWVG